MENGGTAEETLVESIIAEKINGHDSLSSSDTDNERLDSPSSIKPKIYRMFGRERPVHKVLGGGKPADLLLWRDKKVSITLLGAVTVIWALFELVGYHLLTFICHGLILFLALSFLWSNAHTFINKSPEHIPQVYLPEKPFLQIASALLVELNCAFTALRSIALGRDLKKFLMAIAGLWLVSIIGNCFSFLSLVYICFVLIHTVPMLYEKYEDEIDPVAEKAMIEIKKQYQVLDAKVLSKIPISQLKAKLH